MLPHQLARPAAAVGPEDARGSTPGFAVALVLALALTLAGCLVVCALVLSVVHPADATFAQSQGAKTLLYIVCFAGVLPVSLLAAVRLEPVLVRRVGGPAARGLAGLAALTVLLVPLAVRTLSGLGGPGGVHTVLAAGLLWWAAAVAVAVLVRRGSGTAMLARLAGAAPAIEVLAAVAVLGVLLTLTDLPGIDPVALVVALAASAAVLAAVGRISLPRLPRPGGVALDAVFVLVLLLAVPNVVVFTAGGIPSIYFPPGIIQFHQDFLLGPANQLLGGGALLVNVPVSQYGVGFIDFLYGWFHIAPIGYGTYGLLDGIVTALFYVVGYGILRAAGVARALAAAAIALSVVAFVLHLYYVVGALPQQGPLRFGLPIVVVFAAVAAERWPHRRGSPAGSRWPASPSPGCGRPRCSSTRCLFTSRSRCGRPGSPGAERLRLIVRRVAVGIGAVLAGQVVMALWTLAATGSLPDYGGYLAYVDAFVLGHSGEGHVSYGFSPWSPAFAVGLGCLASVAGIVVLALRRPELRPFPAPPAHRARREHRVCGGALQLHRQPFGDVLPALRGAPPAPRRGPVDQPCPHRARRRFPAPPPCRPRPRPDRGLADARGRLADGLRALLAVGARPCPAGPRPPPCPRIACGTPRRSIPAPPRVSACSPASSPATARSW